MGGCWGLFTNVLFEFIQDDELKTLSGISTEMVENHKIRSNRSQCGGCGGTEEINQRTYMHVCITHGQTIACVEGLGWSGGWVEGGKKGEMGDICNNVNKKVNEFKKRKSVFLNPLHVVCVL